MTWSIPSLSTIELGYLDPTFGPNLFIPESHPNRKSYDTREYYHVIRISRWHLRDSKQKALPTQGIITRECVFTIRVNTRDGVSEEHKGSFK